MRFAALTTSLPEPLPEALRLVAELGFTAVDLPAQAVREDADRHALADTGLTVVCTPIGREHRDVERMKRELHDAGQLGATHAYLVPPKDDPRPEALVPFGAMLAELAAFAVGRRIILCVEHFPGTALPSVSATLAWLEQFPDVQLLLDVGHCLISREEPAEAIHKAGSRLGYVHLDDNDGVSDLHWPLFTGVLRREQLVNALHALREVGYTAGWALELSPRLEQPLENLRRSKAVVEDFVEALDA